MTAPLFLFAPGAGAPSTSSWMTAWTKRLASLGRVVTLDYAYQREGRRAPDPLPRLVATHREALESARAGHDGKIVLIGKSMGSRVGCHVALESAVDGLVCFGYPLKGAGPRAAIRDAVLVELRRPILFVQGTRDTLCPLDLLDTVRHRMTARNELMVVEGGDHSLQATVKALRDAKETQAVVDARILAEVGRFVGAL
jgi:predicted alpha/beta-hydrolase family hydrolase